MSKTQIEIKEKEREKKVKREELTYEERLRSKYVGDELIEDKINDRTIKRKV